METIFSPQLLSGSCMHLRDAQARIETGNCAGGMRDIKYPRAFRLQPREGEKLKRQMQAKVWN